MTAGGPPSLSRLAQALGGEVRGHEVLAPGPGHSATDRSLSVKLSDTAKDGFIVHSFAGDDSIACLKHVSAKLGSPERTVAKKKNGGGSAWKVLAEYVYRTEAGEPYLRVRKCLGDNGSKQYPQAHWRDGGWQKGKPAGPKVPYRLPELIAAPLSQPVFIAEGEKCCDALAAQSFVATCNSEGAASGKVASKKWTADLDRWFKDRHVVLLPDNDQPGRAHVAYVAKRLHKIAEGVRILDLALHWPNEAMPEGADVYDWLHKHDPAGVELARLAGAASLYEPDATDGKADDGNTDDVDDGDDGDDALIAELAALSPLHYAKRREQAAKQLGIGVVALDKIVADARAGDGDDAQFKKQADVLVDLANNATLFHTPARDAFADVTVEDHRETYRVRSKAFRSWLAYGFYKKLEGAPNGEAMTAAIGVIEARALFDGPEISVAVRVAGHDDKLYLDLADAKWQAIEIDSDGWRLVSSPPVRFRRAPGMLPLPVPTRGSKLDVLRNLINVRKDSEAKAITDAEFVLIVAWLLAALRNVGPYPVLVLSGEHGTAKSTLCKLLQALIDPNTAELRTLPREERDLFIAASNAHVVAFDNVSGIAAWLSDAMCRLSTGGGFATRQLFSDNDEVLFTASRPVLVNGIEDIATRPDLADRSIMLSLEPIPDSERRLEREMWTTIECERPRILGALLDAMVLGLSRLDQIRLDRLPRMADFALWATACEVALGEPGIFLNAYEANRAASTSTALEADLVATAVRRFMKDRDEWTGTASDLLDVLGLLVTETQRRGKAWPTLPHHLAGRLRRAAPILRKLGIEIEFKRDAQARTINIRQAEEEGKPASSTSPPSFGCDIKCLEQTLDGAPVSGSASSPPTPASANHLNDADGDAGLEVGVWANPLRASVEDAGDADDALLRTLSVTGKKDTTCRQCGGELDGAERPYPIDGQSVWLHPQCHRYYRPKPGSK